MSLVLVVEEGFEAAHAGRAAGEGEAVGVDGFGVFGEDELGEEVGVGDMGTVFGPVGARAEVGYTV